MKNSTFHHYAFGFLLSLFIANFSLFNVFAQNQYKVLGKIIDAADNTPLIGATVVLSPLENPEAGQAGAAVTDPNGDFKIASLPSQTYQVAIKFIGYEDKILTVSILDQNLNLGTIALKASSEILQDVVVEGQQVIAVQKGDTTELNANAFQTQKNANADDLIQKMPSISIENGTVKAQGEEVKQVWVDGKPFFGDDPNAVLKNLPAEVIQKIQIIDRQSDQAQFTGFQDGETQKIINIVTKPEMRTGNFGRIFAGYGDQDRYQAGGNMNFFTEKRRLSIVGLANNINQQNFATEDLAGAMSVSQQNGGRGRRRGGRGGWNRNETESFLVGQQNGIATSQALGINYSDEWGKKIKISGSYFFNRAEIENLQLTDRNFFLSESQNQVYNENNDNQTTNQNHRFNVRLEYKIDDKNELILTPRLSLQSNTQNSLLNAQTTLGAASNLEALSELLNRSLNDNNTQIAAYNFVNDALWRHKFKKEGRTLSLNLGVRLQNNQTQTQLEALNEYYQTGEIFLLDSIRQLADNQSDSRNFNSNLTYTEPIGKKAQLSFGYRNNLTFSQAERETNAFNADLEKFNLLDSALSNRFESQYQSHQPNIGYRYRSEKIIISTSLTYQYAQLDNKQSFPLQNQIQRHFQNLLPFAFVRFNLSEDRALRLIYRTSTQEPNVNQLQNVLDNSNPILLRIGNQDLAQAYTHRFITRYSSNNTDKVSSLFFFFYADYTQNYIGNASYIAQTDTLIGVGEQALPLAAGSQLDRPVNLDGAFNLRTVVTYGVPLKKLRSNLNFNIGLDFRNTPSLINDLRNTAATYAFNQGLVLSSNISQNLDFTLGYNGNYSIVRNSLQPELDNNFYYQTLSAKWTWVVDKGLFKGFLFEGNTQHSLFTGLGEAFNQSFFLVNLGIGKRFLKDERAELKATVFDLLGQNNNISRNVTETYVEDLRSLVLQRYFMLTFSYNLRNFGGKAQNK
ncbi:TonB-dependent receptor [Hugenholtzia roseola]|uniref:TonB-dependent receptor n=1 Tax=Hugenholtzia roseola TaxID=1002 RepID=UPI00041B10A6|nr:TonB-dependent receptor [Hugenholtzia roseola]